MLGENIQQLRKSFSISQVEFAKRIGVTKQCVSNWENGYIQPSLDTLIKIAKFFNVTTDFLLDLQDDNTISIDGLNAEEVAHIKLIISDLKNRQ